MIKGTQRKYSPSLGHPLTTCVIFGQHFLPVPLIVLKGFIYQNERSFV